MVIAAALSLADLGTLRRYWHVRTTSFVALARGHRGRRVLRRAARHPHRRRALDPAVLPAELVAARRGARPRRRSGGLAQRRARRRPPSSGPTCSCTGGRRRCSSPTPACSASRSVTSCASSSPRWVVLQCEAITDIDVTAADMLEQLDTRAERAGHARRVRRAARADSRTSSTATACSRRSTAITSTTRSTRPWPRSTPDRRTPLRRRSRRDVSEHRAPSYDSAAPSQAGILWEVGSRVAVDEITSGGSDHRTRHCSSSPASW